MTAAVGQLITKNRTIYCVSVLDAIPARVTTKSRKTIAIIGMVANSPRSPPAVSVIVTAKVLARISGNDSSPVQTLHIVSRLTNSY